MARGEVEVLESPVHERESAPRPDLGVLELLRELSGGRRMEDPGLRGTMVAERLEAVLRRQLPERSPQPGDRNDLLALSWALPACDLVACDRLWADVVRRAGLDRRHAVEVFGGRRGDVERLTERLRRLG